MSKNKRKSGRPRKPIPKLAETPEQIAKAIFRAADHKTKFRMSDEPIAMG